jgi:gliding motility-associated-like protein
MKATLYTLLFALCLLEVHAQNLIPNPSFEEADACARQRTRPGLINFQVLPVGWQSATSDSATAYHHCYFGNDPLFETRTGDGLGHGYIYYAPAENFDFRTFLQTRLTTPLEEGCTYTVSFYLKPYGRLIVGGSYEEEALFAEDIGLYFSNNRITQLGGYNTFLNYTPQVQQTALISDTTVYTQISGSLIASGGEVYMTLGFFMPTQDIKFKLISGNQGSGKISHSYSVEDFVVEQIASEPVFKRMLPADTIISPGNRMELSTGNPSTQWSTGESGASIVINKPGNYWVRIEEGCYTYVDSIRVVADGLVINIPNAFTPNNDGLNEVLEVGIYGVTSYTAAIYNRWGQRIYEHSDGPGVFRWDGRVQGNLVGPGVYVLTIATDGVYGPQQFMEKIHVLR